ncbi:unnamed protein product [Meganyctiphanes norvegica]|uniref:SCP domain-containing protein n=1 Tax=Meganyctiphanes norvegica TaxID=48144 RepID=A0AAV2RI94_MEGNR
MGIKESSSMLPHLLQQRYNKETCGLPHPKCTTECFYGDKGCVCHQSTYYRFPCKESYKICKEGEHELFDYSKIDPHHSAAMPPNHQCNKINQGVTEEEKQLILDLHNTFRAKVARGEEHRSPHDGVSQPGGSNIKELIWNEELAYIAQKWANQCYFGHERRYSRRATCSRMYDYVGQNLYKIIQYGLHSTSKWSLVIHGWYNEVVNTPISIVESFDSGVTTKKIGHYTQLVWAETSEIGCGAVVYSTMSHYGYESTTLYVCNYGPGGNIIGEEMYKTGEAASECGESGKSTKYPELCATRF